MRKLVIAAGLLAAAFVPGAPAQAAVGCQCVRFGTPSVCMATVTACNTRCTASASRRAPIRPRRWSSAMRSSGAWCGGLARPRSTRSPKTGCQEEAQEDVTAGRLELRKAPSAGGAFVSARNRVDGRGASPIDLSSGLRRAGTSHAAAFGQPERRFRRAISAPSSASSARRRPTWKQTVRGIIAEVAARGDARAHRTDRQVRPRRSWRKRACG